MEHCALWVLRCLLFQLRHHFCYRQQEEPCFPSAQTVLATWVTWILNRIFCFQKTNYWKPFFLLLFFFFFTCHSISHEIKTVIWMTEKYTLLSYYNNDFTPSKKAVQQLSDIKFLTSEMTDNDCANTKLHSHVKEKKFQVNQLQITFSWLSSLIVLIMTISINIVFILNKILELPENQNKQGRGGVKNYSSH